MKADEHCAICGCNLHRRASTYALPTQEGRSHATRHHFVAERFFGRSSNRRGTVREGVFAECPWDAEGKADVFCYECHEELLHNPVILPDDVRRFAELVRLEGHAETEKPVTREALAGRIMLLQRVIARGIKELFAEATGSAD